MTAGKTSPMDEARGSVEVGWPKRLHRKEDVSETDTGQKGEGDVGKHVRTHHKDNGRQLKNFKRDVIRLALFIKFFLLLSGEIMFSTECFVDVKR